MIKTFKFAVKFEQGNAVLGTIPAGRIVKSEPLVEDGKPMWLIEVDVDFERERMPPTEIYRPLPGRPLNHP